MFLNLFVETLRSLCYEMSLFMCFIQMQIFLDSESVLGDHMALSFSNIVENMKKEMENSRKLCKHPN